jgi:hypothetical protein
MSWIKHTRLLALVPIEKVILDNEEKTTTYAETGDTGLLLDEVSLPAPRNQHVIALVYNLSAEVKYVDNAGRIALMLWDGTSEYQIGTFVFPSTAYRFFGITSLELSETPLDRSLKGNTALKLRVYLVGVSGAPNARQYCRNCVLTVVPIYKT